MFAAVMAVLLAGLIAFLYLHFRSDLDYNINQSAARACAGHRGSRPPAGRGRDTSGALRQLPASADNVVQVLDQSGPGAGGAAPGFCRSRPLLQSGRAADRGGRAPKLIQREATRFGCTRCRCPATTRSSSPACRWPNATRRSTSSTTRSLIGVPPALLLATLAAYGLAAAALRPVERMRQRAATISTDEISTRLPLPESQDEIRRLGDTLNEMLDRLEDGLNHERMFIANASHELRMPLAVLKAELEVSLRERGGERALRDAMGSAVEETDRIIKLAEDLLLLARAEDGTLPIDAHDRRRGRVAGRARGAVLARVRARRDAPLEVDVESRAGGDGGARRPGPHRAGDRQPDRQHASLRRRTDHARARAPADGTVEIHVTDSGPGFGEQFLPHAFDRFSRGDPARRRGGVGLGLAIVRTIAQTHGGDAGARDIPGGGADAWISLPAAAELAVWRERDPV